MTSIKDTITLADAQRLTGKRAFNLMIKPAGSLCNLNCSYCYYLDKAGIYGGKEPRMSHETLEAVIRAYIAANEVDDVMFVWHGGEPLIMGLDFFRKALELERKYAAGKTITNTIQTNGTLITQEWADFFKTNDFLVGVSIDGPRSVHDAYRFDKGGAPTFDKVLRGIEILYRTGVEYNTMSTINRASEGRGLETYRFLKSIGGKYQQFMPVVEHVRYIGNRPHIVDPKEENARLAPWSVSSPGFGRFLCDIFDDWFRNDVGRIFVNLFDNTLALWCNVPNGTCAYSETCGGNPIVEHNGDIYPCDHFVYPQYRIGNILETDVASLMESPRMVRFGLDKRNGLPRKCLRCKWYFACHGECPKHRFNTTEAGETGLNALCEGYKMFYDHVAPCMDHMRDAIIKKETDL